MATGIVSVALRLDGQHLLSVILLAITAGAWLALTALVVAEARRHGRRLRSDAHDPAALTAVAGTEVIGTGLTLAGWTGAGAALLILGSAAWLGLLPLVLSAWRTPTVGGSFMLTVATESVALLAATLGLSTHAAWLVYAALVPFCLGLGFYAFVLSRFDFRQLLTGAGDHWVTGGALAISALAAGRIADAASGIGVLSGGHETLKTLALVLWCLSLVWLPVLVAAELIRPRLSYDVRRWSTVFPVGMYAAASFTVGELTRTRGITDFAQVWVWVAVAVWAIAFAAMCRLARVS